MRIKFKKIRYGSRFCDDFDDMKANNVLEFNGNRVCVVYGPNGTGKTSLSELFSRKDPDSEYAMEIDDVEFTNASEPIFHVIEDQNGRNIIAGSTEEFILGDDIKKEYELKKKLEDGFDNLFRNKLVGELKSNFGISKKSTQFDSLITNDRIKFFVSDIANSRSKGASIKRDEYIREVEALSDDDIDESEIPFFKYFIGDFGNENSIIRNMLSISALPIRKEEEYRKIEESQEALRIIEKYPEMKECIVCDSDVDRSQLFERKTAQHSRAIASLSKESQQIVETIISKIVGEDPFEIKTKLEKALSQGTNEEIVNLAEIIDVYKSAFNYRLCKMLKTTLLESGLSIILMEYSTITQKSPEFENEDIIFIEKFLNDCLERQIHLVRDGEKNLRLLLGDDEFLNRPRKELALSNGEQNFLSLAFELLKARKMPHGVVVLDDPISSFDSIYKNKISYAVLKILDNKNTIVMTHNTDLIKLLEHQRQKSFKLYQLHNRSEGENGLVAIERDEVKILLYIHEFINLLRGAISAEIVDEKRFLISLVPFMRGYCQIVGNIDDKNLLTTIMHGYGEDVVNISDIYSRLFGSGVIKSEHKIGIIDILGGGISEEDIIRPDKYPLLARTLLHTYSYLYLRIAVEKKLVDKYKINTSEDDMLTKIIFAAFKTDSREDIENRVFFLSRKTLLNEFNHFEMDMNIFMPAIDIQNRVLKREKKDILEKLSQI